MANNEQMSNHERDIKKQALDNLRRCIAGMNAQFLAEKELKNIESKISKLESELSS